MNSYIILKHLHMTFVALSATGFVLRGRWMLRGSPLLQHKLTKILPHIIDTGLLASGIALAVTIGASPMAQPWLMAKLIGLVAYIVLGTIALKRGPTLAIRAAAMMAALVCLSWMASVAITKSPAGFWGNLF